MAKWTQSKKLQVQDKIILVKHEAKNKQKLTHAAWLLVLILGCVATYLIK